MLPPVVQQGISEIVSKTVKHAPKLIWAAIAATGTFVAEEYSKAKAKAKARREGEASGYQKGYTVAKNEDADEIGRARSFISKIKGKNKK